MKSYVKFLLEDIRFAFMPRDHFSSKSKSESNDDLDEHFAEIERWLNMDSEPSFGSYCGLKRADFPPKEYFTQRELKEVVMLFERMMFSWNLTLDIPRNLPIARKYELMMDILDKPTLIVKDGFVGFDYCTGNPEGCELGEYCPCLKSEYYHPKKS
ncbi:hypothetical protein [Algoriphagus sp.]|uniref:hypothetical protein n=1 Tax=Algoriphagus sp. TaxID=1872435 RepID=UPI003296386F